MVSQSQIGFIDFIITPTFNLLCQLFLSINAQLESKAEEILRQHSEDKQADNEEMLHKVRTSNELRLTNFLAVENGPITRIAYRKVSRTGGESNSFES